MKIGIATPPGMTAANGYFSAASALGYDREEGLAFDMYYGEEPAATARALCAGTCDIASLNTTVGLLGREQELLMRAVYGKARRTHRWFAVMPDTRFAISGARQLPATFRTCSRSPRRRLPKRACRRAHFGGFLGAAREWKRGK